MPARVARANYESMARKRLSMHKWNFATYPVALVYQGQRDVGRLQHAYIVPPDALRVHWVGLGPVRLDVWHLDTNRILAPINEALEALITFRAPESKWPADFAEAFITDLEALFIKALVRNPQDARMRERDAEVQFRTAMAADRRQGVSDHARPAGALARAWVGAATVEAAILPQHQNS